MLSFCSLQILWFMLSSRSLQLSTLACLLDAWSMASFLDLCSMFLNLLCIMEVLYSRLPTPCYPYCMGSLNAVFAVHGAHHGSLHGLLHRCPSYGLCCSYPLALVVYSESSPRLVALLATADAGSWKCLLTPPCGYSPRCPPLSTKKLSWI